MAFMANTNGLLMSACASFSGNSTAINGSCSGVGCCHSTFHKGLKTFEVGISPTSTSPPSTVGTGTSKPLMEGTLTDVCGFVFFTDQDYFIDVISRGNLTQHITDHGENTTLESHVVIDWVVDSNYTCAEALAAAGYDNPMGATKYACGPNSKCCCQKKCYDSKNGPEYVCSCQDGFYGNPYLPHGCQDIDECKDPEKYPCHGTCTDVPGNYTCRCPLVTHGDGKVACEGTHLGTLTAVISMSSGFMISVGMLYVLRIYAKEKKRQGLKKEYFAKNGGLLLERQISSLNGELAKTRIFTYEELEKATEPYNKSHILGKGDQVIVYKGMLSEETIIAIKKPVKMEEGLIEEFINEMIILSQINHKHVVKLLGYCLETQVPLLVYEYISNDTLSTHIHDQKEDLPLQWTDRLQTATEVAGALVYMHYAISTPIYHKDIKSSNILLDEKVRAKVSDFGISRYVPLEKTHLTTLVKGTFGYLDLSTSDQTSLQIKVMFIVMVLYLMGQKPLSTIIIEGNKGLAAQFLSVIKENRLFDVLDPQVMEEAKREKLLIVAHVAKSCSELRGRKRPTMLDVAIELENLKKKWGRKYFSLCGSLKRITLEASNRWGHSPIDTMEIAEDNEVELVVVKISDEHNTM